MVTHNVPLPEAAYFLPRAVLTWRFYGGKSFSHLSFPLCTHAFVFSTGTNDSERKKLKRKKSLSPGLKPRTCRLVGYEGTN